jgi:hypothetical protein
MAAQSLYWSVEPLPLCVRRHEHTDFGCSIEAARALSRPLQRERRGARGVPPRADEPGRGDRILQEVRVRDCGDARELLQEDRSAPCVRAHENPAAARDRKLTETAEPYRMTGNWHVDEMQLSMGLSRG